MIRVTHKKINKVTRIEVHSELLDLHPLLNIPIREGKFMSKHIVKRPEINDWFNKHF